jgi:hypothetical protein
MKFIHDDVDNDVKHDVGDDAKENDKNVIHDITSFSINELKKEWPCRVCLNITNEILSPFHPMWKNK